MTLTLYEEMLSISVSTVYLICSFQTLDPLSVDLPGYILESSSEWTFTHVLNGYNHKKSHEVFG